MRFPPPTLFAAGFLLALWLDRSVEPLRLAGEGARGTLKILGWAIAALGLALSAWGVITFRRAGTAVVPMHDATRLVSHGPYRFTRNPMYVGMTLVFIGLSFAFNTAWPLVLLPPVLWALMVFVIRKEERHLTEAFGEEYQSYRARVRRWI